MGFRKPDLGDAEQAIRRCISEISSPYNDGWTSSACKHDLYVLKSWLEDGYSYTVRDDNGLTDSIQADPVPTKRVQRPTRNYTRAFTQQGGDQCLRPHPPHPTSHSRVRRM